MEREDSYISSLACCIEMIRSGVTTFAEAGGQEVEGMARAVEETDIRGILARSTMDCGQGLPEKWQETAKETLAVQEDLISKWHGSAGGRIRVWFALRTIFNVSDRLIQMTNDLAVKYGVGIHMHVAEVREEVNYARENRVTLRLSTSQIWAHWAEDYWRFTVYGLMRRKLNSLHTTVSSYHIARRPA